MRKAKKFERWKWLTVARGKIGALHTGDAFVKKTDTCLRTDFMFASTFDIY